MRKMRLRCPGDPLQPLATLSKMPRGEGTLRHRTPSQGLQALQALHISSNFPATLATLATLTRNPLKLLAIPQG